MAEMLFRRETGHTIHDEIRDVRLERIENPRHSLRSQPLCGSA
jgi:hypothetical protein